MKLYDQYDIHQKGVLDKGAMKRLATDSIGKS